MKATSVECLNDFACGGRRKIASLETQIIMRTNMHVGNDLLNKLKDIRLKPYPILQNTLGDILRFRHNQWVQQ